MYECMPECMCVHYVCAGVHDVKKMALDPLELSFRQM